MKRKAQGANQVFVYILTILIVGVVFLFGYQAINTLLNNTNRVAIINFKTDITSHIKKITPSYGEVQKKEYSIGSDYKKACFIKTDYADTAINPNDFTVYPAILDEVKSRTGNNLFLLGSKNNLLEKFNIGKISFDETNLIKCIDMRNGRLVISIEGRGDHVIIS
jgi:hypothetical protein